MTFAVPVIPPWAQLLAKAIAFAIVIAVLALTVRKLYSIPYDQGVADERARQQTDGAKVAHQARVDEQASTTTSEGVADATRASNATTIAAAKAATDDSLGRIEYVYVTNPELAKPCAADGGPVHLPASVLDELDAAAAAANEAAAAAR